MPRHRQTSRASTNESATTWRSRSRRNRQTAFAASIQRSRGLVWSRDDRWRPTASLRLSSHRVLRRHQSSPGPPRPSHILVGHCEACESVLDVPRLPLRLPVRLGPQWVTVVACRRTGRSSLRARRHRLLARRWCLGRRDSGRENEDRGKENDPNRAAVDRSIRSISVVLE